MIYAGIDIASEKHECCILNEDKVVLEQFSFPNTQLGFQSLEAVLLKYASRESIRIGLEATGVYGNTLTCFLRRKGFAFMTFNPLAVHKRLCATTLRKTKTDKCDAKFLASLLTLEQFKPDHEISYHISELKSLSRARFNMVKNCSKAKVKVKALLMVLFPEIIGAFSDIFCASSLEALRKYPSAKDFAECRISTLRKLLLSKSRGRIGSERADMIVDLAKHSVGIYSEVKRIELVYYLEQILMDTKYIKLLDDSIKKIMNTINSPILSVPGISYTLGALILSELGSIDRFATPAQVLAFSGLEPSVYQSGKHSMSSGSMVKRGSPYLRWALGQAARTVPRFDPTFSVYLNKKLSEGKHFCVASSHVAKKLVRVLFSLLKNNTLFANNYSPSAA